MHLRCWTVTLALAVLGGPANAQLPELGSLLAPGTIRLEVLEALPPPRFLELSAKVRAAVQADPTWFLAYTKAATPGSPLPYDPRLGVTQDEYDTMLRLADSLTMVPADTASVEVLATMTGWEFSEGTDIEVLRGLAIDTLHQMVRSSYGELPEADPILASPAQRATGPWTARRWRLPETGEDVGSVTTAAFAIGRHHTGRTVLHFDGRVVRDGQLVRRDRLFALSIE
jgi:hypothetical protein